MAGALSPTEAAERLGVSKLTVLRLLRAGRLPAIKIGHRTWRITEQALQSFMAGESSNTPSKPTKSASKKERPKNDGN